ncbi:uncharacterized protein LOC110450842 [Mizuhopecten yessoensis]|uniref:Uncharacterized protein n=1 Tax=Mizuhopecten yessoensis TaxID=6573 RepID=A0A210QN31_MIZYE|nr:uncharacterized protein LOC110450842 [Mizuhopecten yessoensis]OWF50147.1 hypothetical protein KP79_PYT14105 [Mizuhopecten yessoensis]
MFLIMDLLYNTEWILSLWTLLQIIHVQGSNTTSSSGSSGTNYDASTKLIATVCIIIAAIIISVVVAKIADMCYDRHVLRDDASDVSDHTKGLIRARLAIIQMKKKDKSKKTSRNLFRIWSAKTRRANQQQGTNNSSNTQKERSVVINVDEAPQTDKNTDKYSQQSGNNSPSRVHASTISAEAKNKKQGASKTQNSQKTAKSPMPQKTPAKQNKVDKAGSKKQAASTDKRVTFREERNVMEIQSVSTLGAQA